MKWSDPGQSTSAHVGFIYKYDQDASGKIDAAFATSANWRYTPTIAEQENYAGPATNASGDPVNALDQYADVDMDDGAGALTQTYDGAGNLTSVGDGRTYTYNSENQFIRAEKTGVFDMEYWYDAQGRRSQTIDHINGTETFHKHWGQMEIGDYDVTRVGGVTPTLIGTGGNPPPIPAKVTGYSAQFHVILGQGVDNRIAFHDVSRDELSFYLTNHQGSTVAMTDEDGKILSHANGGRYVYDAYGAEVSGAPPTGQPFRYTGRRLDANTGLYYYRARYYDTNTGRFLQTDPIGYQDQMNLYNYVGNDPVNYTDPSGLAARGSFLSSHRLEGIGGQLGTGIHSQMDAQAHSRRSQDNDVVQCAAFGACGTPSGTKLAPNGRPYSDDFWNSYMNYNSPVDGGTSTDTVWKEVGGSLGAKGLDPQQPNYFNSCATRVSCALNASGFEVPYVKGKTEKTFGGKNSGLRFVIKARDMRVTLRTWFGEPNFENTNDLAVKAKLLDGQVAIFAANGHTGVTKKGYNDVISNADFWVLPVK